MTTEKCDATEEEIYKVLDRYLVFIDETGDPFLHKNIEKYKSPTVFPVMTVTALIIKASVYKDVFVPSVDAIKEKFFSSREIHFHSNEIRRKDGIFKTFLDDAKYQDFKSLMTNTLENASVTIISSSINKMKLLQKTEKFKASTGEDYNIGDLYLTNVGWVMERVGHFLKGGDTAKIIFETRGRKESKRIQAVLTEVKKNGSFYHAVDRFKNINDEILFFTKKDNVNGLQLVDYCTYPFARYAKDKTDENMLFEILRKFVYKGDYGEYGLKEWP